MSGWISVDREMPDHEGSVWCWGTYDGQYAEVAFEGSHRHGRWVCLNNGDYFDGGYGDDYHAMVTHWMPLPLPPQK